MVYAIKAEIQEPHASTFVFEKMKTMYGGKNILPGDKLFIFASETQGGNGLIGRGVVTAATMLPKRQNGARETPRVSVSVAHLTRTARHFGRNDVKSFKNWKDSDPATELNFKFYRQNTNKIVGISDRTAAFLEHLL